MIVKRLLKLIVVFVSLVGISGFYNYQRTYADDDSPLFNLETSKSTVNVGDQIVVQSTQLEQPDAVSAELQMVIPTGLDIDKPTLKQAATSENFQYRQENDNLILLISDQTKENFQLIFIAQTAGTYSVSLLNKNQSLVSNVLQIVGEQTQSQESSTSSSSDQSQASSSSSNETSAAEDSSQVTSTDSSKESSSVNSSEKVKKETSSQTNKADETSSSSQSKMTTKSARTIANSVFSVDQATSVTALTYLYYYADSNGQPISGYVQDPDKENVSVSYIMNKVSGSGPAPPQAGVSQSLGTIQTTGGNVKDKFSFTIPSSKLPTYATAVGSVYSMRLNFSDNKGSIRSFNFRFVYLTGQLSIIAPDQIDFGTALDATATGNPVYMGTIGTGSQALAVKDTRTIPSGVTMNGWSLTVSLAKQMTGETTSGVLTNSLHYLNEGTDYTLSSAASPVKKLAISTPNTTTNISDSWNSKNGLAFEHTAGQPVAGEKYSGTVTWNLQDTPANK